ncbi:hypothetical protein ACFCYM_27175 [Streptomyces sp. NPDC056254]|uniref:hypothetical protein n=1 Tax=Streptomyces sp. NPDC056254 TaxID=3345763 RepID=UPI0035DBD1E5
MEDLDIGGGWQGIALLAIADAAGRYEVQQGDGQEREEGLRRMVVQAAYLAHTAEWALALDGGSLDGLVKHSVSGSANQPAVVRVDEKAHVRIFTLLFESAVQESRSAPDLPAGR